MKREYSTLKNPDADSKSKLYKHPRFSSSQESDNLQSFTIQVKPFHIYSNSDNVPNYKEPKEISYFSYDHQRRIHFDRSSLKYYYVSPDPPSSPISLSKGFESRIERQEVEEHLDGLLKSLLHSQRIPSRQLREEKNVKVANKIITWRGIMTKILTTPFNFNNPWLFRVTRLNDVIYIEEPLEERKKLQSSSTTHPKQSEMCYWGYNFEAISTLEKPKVSYTIGKLQEALLERERLPQVNTNIQFCSVIETKLGENEIILGGEVDCVDDVQALTQESECKHYVELKTSKMIQIPREQESFERYKLLNIWAQSFLLGIPKVIVGFRDKDGKLCQRQSFSTLDIPKKVKGKKRSWDPRICLQFSNYFLSKLGQLIQEDKEKEGGCTYTVSYSSPFREVVVEKDSESRCFLPEWENILCIFRDFSARIKPTMLNYPVYEVSSKQSSRALIKRKLVQFAKKHIHVLSIVAFFLGLVSILILPHQWYPKSTYISENALLPDHAHYYFNYERVKDIEIYYQELRGLLANVTDPIELAEKYILALNRDYKILNMNRKRNYVTSQFQKLGLNTESQSFSYLQGKKRFNGYNVVGILQAAKATGTESMVLSAPWDILNDNFDRVSSNIQGVAFILTMAKFLKNFSYFAKDVLFLINDHGNIGSFCWTRAYHGIDSPPSTSSSIGVTYGPLFHRSGEIQAALNIELPNDGLATQLSRYKTLGIFYEGLNGQLPNLDLLNTVNRIATNHYISVTLREQINQKLPDVGAPWNEWSTYNIFLRHLLDGVAYGSRGWSNMGHNFFLQYNIQALTLRPFYHEERSEYGYEFSFDNFGSTVEATLRSCNNLLERFHQSFFLYLLPYRDYYISIAHYSPPLFLLAASLIFKSLSIWWNIQQDNKIQGDIHNKLTFSTDLAYGLGVLTACGFSGLSVLILPYTLMLLIPDITPKLFFLFITVTFLFSFLCTFQWALKNVSKVPITRRRQTELLLVFSLSMCGIIFMSLSPLNFALSLVNLGLLSIPCLIVRQTNHIFYKLLSFQLLLITSPLSLLILNMLYHHPEIGFNLFSHSALNPKDALEAIGLLVEIGGTKTMQYWIQWKDFGSWWILAECLGYWPVHLALWMVSLL